MWELAPQAWAMSIPHFSGLQLPFCQEEKMTVWTPGSSMRFEILFILAQGLYSIKHNFQCLLKRKDAHISPKLFSLRQATLGEETKESFLLSAWASVSFNLRKPPLTLQCLHLGVC